MTDLFLSYSRDDSLVMQMLRDNLRKLGFNVWVDIEYLEPGTRQWVRAIKEAVLRVDGMIVLCSSSAESSEWVNREVTIARLAGKTIFPVLIDGDVLESMPAELIGAQYIDMRGRSEPARGFRALAASLAKRYGLALPDFTFAVDDALSLPPIQVINVSGHVEGSVIAISGDLAVQGDFVAGDQNIGSPTLQAGVRTIEMSPVTISTPAAPRRDPILQFLPGPFEWCEVPGNSRFVMRSDTGIKGSYAIAPFLIGKYLLTAEQFQVFIDDPYGYQNAGWLYHLDLSALPPGGPETPRFSKQANLPRDRVSWYEAVAFCRWLSSHVGYTVRLPNEWEWQWAAQGLDGFDYPYGQRFDPTLSNTLESGYYGTTPVNSFADGASPCGALDMSGNLWEWCRNEYRDVGNVQGGGDPRRAVRGGSWNHPGAVASTFYRGYRRPDSPSSVIGFRLMAVLPG